MNHRRPESTWIFETCRRRLRDALAFSLAFRILDLAFFAPLAAGIVRLCLQRWGRASVGNFEIAAFFLSPAGIAALLGGGAILLGTRYLELSGLIRLLVDHRLRWWEALTSSPGAFYRLVQLGLRQLATYLLLALPFFAGVLFVYLALWHGKDLNGLIILKPPAFWWGVAIAGCLAAIYCVLAFRRFVQWVYAVPILTCEPRAAIPAVLRASVDRTHGEFWHIASTILAWAAFQVLLTAVVMAAVTFGTRAALGLGGSSIGIAVALTATVLAIHAAAILLLSTLANVSLAAVTLSLYHHVAPGGDFLSPSQPIAKSGPWRGWMAGAALLLLAAVSIAMALAAVHNLALGERLELTAHRAGATHAPENSVAALKQAIADEADWAEIDVQLTADNAIVVMHDVDLARVGGGDRRVAEATLAEIQSLDIGAPIGEKFAGERIPTFHDILVAAGDRIRLNVELTPHGKADGPELTRRVVDEIRQANMVAGCRICSQSFESIQLAREIEPRLQIGFIVATAVGDPSQLKVDFLMVKDKLATRRFVDRSHVREVSVHAWTINDPSQVAPLLDAGVDNLITDDVPLIRAQLAEIRALSTIERLLLRTRTMLAP
jgi:glycerophosphoryl diester phosphodiesterase